MRWGFRVMCYAMIMITDKYPPFALEYVVEILWQL